MGRIKAELEDLSFKYLDPEAHRALTDALEGRRKVSEAFIAEIREKLTSALEEAGIRAEIRGRIKSTVLDLPQDAGPEDRRGPGLRLRGVPAPDRLDQGLLRGARHRPFDLATGSGPDQGLHRDAEAQHVPVAPHVGDDGDGAAVRGADPDPRDAPDRRGGDRGALAVQGGRDALGARRREGGVAPADPRVAAGAEGPAGVHGDGEGGPLSRRRSTPSPRKGGSSRSPAGRLRWTSPMPSTPRWATTASAPR